MKKDLEKSSYITLGLPVGRLKPDEFATVNNIVQRYKLTVYFTTTQNIRLLGVREKSIEDIQSELTSAGISIKKSGQFPLPKVCAGPPFCKFGKADPTQLSAKILEQYGNMTGMKPKIKIAISACPANCSGAVLADIGIVATGSGYEIHVGGKGGLHPKAGIRVMKKVDEDTVVKIIGQLVDFHKRNTKKRQRMYKLLSDPEFPIPVKKPSQ